MSQHYLSIKQRRNKLNQIFQSEEESSHEDAFRKLPEIIAKHKRREPLSRDDLCIIARKIFPILGRSDEITLSTNFTAACAELLFASVKEFKEKRNHLMLLFVDEIYNFPFHPMNSEQTADKILQYLISTNKVDDTNRDKIFSATHLLIKLYNRHCSKGIDSSLNVCGNDFNIILCPYPDNKNEISLSLFGCGHNKYKEIMRSRPSNSTIIKCESCNLEQDKLTTIEDLILLIAKNGPYCTCWEKFVEANPGRNIQPCSAKGCDGSLCPFCDHDKEMQFMEFIAVINDSFKNGSLSEDVYNDFFDTFCQIIIGGSTMPVMPLMTKLLFYLPSVSIELYQKLFHLIAKFEIFFRRMNCLPRPNFLSKPNLRDFTKADYDAYMDELKRGQEHFETDIPKLGFCCCNENIEYRVRLEERRKMIEQRNHDEKVADAAVARFKGISVNRC